MRVHWTDLDRAPAYGGGEHGEPSAAMDSSSAVSSSGQQLDVPNAVPEVEVPLRQLRPNPRKNPKFLYAATRSSTHDFPYDAFTVSKAYTAYGAKITVGKALKTSEAEMWKEAMSSEIMQLINTGTLESIYLCDMPSDATVINSSMVLVKKPDKYKARLCACGNELKGQVEEIYSPTIGALTYAAVHQIAIIDDMVMRIVDTVGAYLYQPYPETSPPIFVRMPVKVMDALDIEGDVVYRVKKFIYGLPDAGRAYYRAYSKLLMDSGYQKSKSDPCLFFKICVGGDRIYIWIHVDDTFVAASTPDLLDELEDILRNRFQITVKNNVEDYPGVHYTRLYGVT